MQVWQPDNVQQGCERVIADLQRAFRLEAYDSRHKPRQSGLGALITFESGCWLRTGAPVSGGQSELHFVVVRTMYRHSILGPR